MVYKKTASRTNGLKRGNEKWEVGELEGADVAVGLHALTAFTTERYSDWRRNGKRHSRRRRDKKPARVSIQALADPLIYRVFLLLYYFTGGAKGHHHIPLGYCCASFLGGLFSYIVSGFICFIILLIYFINLPWIGKTYYILGTKKAVNVFLLWQHGKL